MGCLMRAAIASGPALPHPPPNTHPRPLTAAVRLHPALLCQLTGGSVGGQAVAPGSHILPYPHLHYTTLKFSWGGGEAPPINRDLFIQDVARDWC